jgi:hypothetical protein
MELNKRRMYNNKVSGLNNPLQQNEATAGMNLSLQNSVMPVINKPTSLI